MKLEEQKSIEEQTAEEKKKRRAIFVIVLILLSVTVGVYVYYSHLIFLLVNMF